MAGTSRWSEQKGADRSALSDDGRDEAAIRAGVAATLGGDRSAAAFFARLQLDELRVQSAMLILRQCGVPKMNFALRCIPPPCIAVRAAAFDELVLGTAKAKLLLHDDETKRRPTVDRLRALSGMAALASSRRCSHRQPSFSALWQRWQVPLRSHSSSTRGFARTRLAAARLDREQHGCDHRRDA